MSTPLNDLEHRALQRLLAGGHPVLERLRRQLTEAEAAGRQPTGDGFVTRLAVPGRVPRLGSGKPFQILDVYGEIAGLGSEASFILFVEDGALSRLECQTLDDAWPERPRLQRLFYMRPKSPGSADLVETPERDLAWALIGAPTVAGEGGGREAGGGDRTPDSPALEVEMATSKETELSPDATQEISTFLSREARRRAGQEEGEEEKTPALRPPESPPEEPAQEKPATLSNRRTMALVMVNAVLATVLGIGLVAMLVLARERSQEAAAPASALPFLSQELLLDALLTFVVAGAVGACLANLGGLFRHSRETDGLPVRLEGFYYLRPLVGALTALLAFFVTSTAVFAFSGGTAGESWTPLPGRMAYVALSLFLGFGAYEALDRLREVLRALFSR